MRETQMGTKAFGLFILCLAFCGVKSAGAAGEAQSASIASGGNPVYFLRDVFPVINELGCNAAKCHGGPVGKSGFKLSMFGADAESDYAALCKQAGSRRINRIEPPKSLFLLKATASMDHGGGKKIEAGSPRYNLLARWIAQGAPWSGKSVPELVSIEVSPREQVLEKGGTIQLRAVAVFSDGTREDVTAEGSYDSAGEAVASVDDGGKVQAAGFGQTAIIASYLHRFDTVRIVVPQPLPFPFPELAANNKIDELVHARLRKLGIPPSDLCPDQVFLRRVYLDMVGTLPAVEEVRRFLSDPDAQKRSKLIDELLDSEEFADYWALKWGDLFRVKSEYPSNLWPNAVQAYHRWIRDSIAKNKPFDRFATELITSSGSNFRIPPVNYYRAFLTREPQNLAEVTALIFMGARIGCARCHAHPLESWTLEDNLGLAAFFAKVRYKRTREWKEEIVYTNPRGNLLHPKIRTVVPPRFPGGEVPEMKAEEDPRVKFARWLTAPENPWFARNIVNRTWFWLLGRGIVHEPDDLRSTNPPENPALLEYLEHELVGHEYDLKHIYRLILNSRTYQLSSRTNQYNQNDVAHFSHYQVKRLGAETLLDAIGQVTGRWDSYRSRIPEPFVVLPTGYRATHLADGSIDLPFLQLFGRPPRDTAYESDRDLELSMRQTLHLLNSSDVQNKINASPRLGRMMQEIKEDQKIIEELYLSTVSRFPTEEESKRISDYLSGAGKAAPAEVLAGKKAAEEALAGIKKKLEMANTEYRAAEKAVREAKKGDVEKTREMANQVKARRDRLVRDEQAAGTRLADAVRKLNAARAALRPRRDLALRDLLWALLNTKEFVFNH